IPLSSSPPIPPPLKKIFMLIKLLQMHFYTLDGSTLKFIAYVLLTNSKGNYQKHLIALALQICQLSNYRFVLNELNQ
ncbi:hypothetical protein WDZ92_15275, partial [Nostoc sp. NIES-2111]